MCDPQVRFCERRGGASPSAYSTKLDRQVHALVRRFVVSGLSLYLPARFCRFSFAFVHFFSLLKYGNLRLKIFNVPIND